MTELNLLHSTFYSFILLMYYIYGTQFITQFITLNHKYICSTIILLATGKKSQFWYCRRNSIFRTTEFRFANFRFFGISILYQMELHLIQNRKENCHHDHIPFNVKGNIVSSVQTQLIITGNRSKLSNIAGATNYFAPRKGFNSLA